MDCHGALTFPFSVPTNISRNPGFSKFLDISGAKQGRAPATTIDSAGFAPRARRLGRETKSSSGLAGFFVFVFGRASTAPATRTLPNKQGADRCANPERSRDYEHVADRLLGSFRTCSRRPMPDTRFRRREAARTNSPDVSQRYGDAGRGSTRRMRSAAFNLRAGAAHRRH